MLRRRADRIRSLQPNRFHCGSCNEKVTAKDRYCRSCGRRLHRTTGDMRQYHMTSGHFNEETSHWEGLDGYYGRREVQYVATGDEKRRRQLAVLQHISAALRR